MPRHKILIADDEPSHRRVLRDAVARLGHDVVTAVNGVEAVALFERESPDLVLLDMKMPGMDGFAALEELRQRDLQTLERCGGNRTRCAQVLGLSVRGLRYKLRKYGV